MVPATKVDDPLGQRAEPPPTESEVRTADLAGAESHASAPSEREKRIRDAAYAAYERRGREPGREEEDWLEAEKELDAEARQEPTTGKSGS
jgi:hypothetical protein